MVTVLNLCLDWPLEWASGGDEGGNRRRDTLVETSWRNPCINNAKSTTFVSDFAWNKKTNQKSRGAWRYQDLSVGGSRAKGATFDDNQPSQEGGRRSGGG